jgi:hypothetical protein
MAPTEVTMRATSLTRLLLLSLPLALARAGETDLSALTLGKIILGPPVTTESLAGKVVMVEFWGTH